MLEPLNVLVTLGVGVKVEEGVQVPVAVGVDDDEGEEDAEEETVAEVVTEVVIVAVPLTLADDDGVVLLEEEAEPDTLPVPDTVPDDDTDGEPVTLLLPVGDSVELAE